MSASPTSLALPADLPRARHAVVTVHEEPASRGAELSGSRRHPVCPASIKREGVRVRPCDLARARAVREGGCGGLTDVAATCLPCEQRRLLRQLRLLRWRRRRHEHLGRGQLPVQLSSSGWAGCARKLPRWLPGTACRTRRHATH